ncbi:hypothetical protein QYM36_004996 [Artemia franciscana]|uniref:Uncharacterized protein n=1 Tax=Artemia franciscana TaxID=6661 RepID=A0AA88HYB6_ARTSF|nr:hypothetical protein QYM36_004996 [Artemia franciscana]
MTSGFIHRAALQDPAVNQTAAIKMVKVGGTAANLRRPIKEKRIVSPEKGMELVVYTPYMSGNEPKLLDPEAEQSTSSKNSGGKASPISPRYASMPFSSTSSEGLRESPGPKNAKKKNLPRKKTPTFQDQLLRQEIVILALLDKVPIEFLPKKGQNIATKAYVNHITDIPLKKKLCDLIWEYKDVLSTSEDDIGLIPFYEHAIQTTGLPVAKQPYYIPYKHKEWLINKIQELERNEIIRPNISPYSAPVILVPKKNNDLRLVVDYTALNKQVVSDKIALPRIEEILDSISNRNKIFTSLDLTQG